MLCLWSLFSHTAGLSSHSRAHDRQNRYEEVNAMTLKQSLKQRKLISQDFLSYSEGDENVNNSIAAQRSPSPSKTLTANPSSVTRSDPDVQVDGEPLPDDSPNLPQPTNANEETVTMTLNNPDDPLPSHEYFQKFQQIHNSDEL